jgi:hypothetical protein
MAERPKPDPNAELHRTLNNACRKWSAREIRLRYLPKPSLSRWIAEALIEHGWVVEKMRADISAGELDPDTSMGAFVIQYSGRCSTIRLRSLGFTCLSGLVMKPAPSIRHQDLVLGLTLNREVLVFGVIVFSGASFAFRISSFGTIR